MDQRREDLGKAIERLRFQLYCAVGDNLDNIGKKQVQEISSALDKLIVQWVRS